MIFQEANADTLRRGRWSHELLVVASQPLDAFCDWHQFETDSCECQFV